MAELAVNDLDVFYGRVQALRQVSLHVERNECIGILGPNGAGKSSLFRAISRLVPYRGSVTLDGEPVVGPPEAVVRTGIAHVLEGRHILAKMSVKDNLLLARFAANGADFEQRLESVLDLFPLLREKYKLPGGSLSGGQQQMLAIARALMTRPRILLLDEPSLGLAPVVIEQLASIIPMVIREWDTTVILSEQFVQLVLEVADRIYVLNRGRIVRESTADMQALDPELLARYLGGDETDDG